LPHQPPTADGRRPGGWPRVPALPPRPRRRLLSASRERRRVLVVGAVTCSTAVHRDPWRTTATSPLLAFTARTRTLPAAPGSRRV